MMMRVCFPNTDSKQFAQRHMYSSTDGITNCFALTRKETRGTSRGTKQVALLNSKKVQEDSRGGGSGGNCSSSPRA
jgi:hypothetical protein